MEVAFSETQINRLVELGLKQNELQVQYKSFDEREIAYKQIEKTAVAKNRNKLIQLTEKIHQPKIFKLQRVIENCLHAQGFTQVTTPTIISRRFLERMTIDGTHPLNEQVFWIDNKTCLRPMLAPNLYEVSQKLMNFSKMPLKLFEIGSCFRKESEGKTHLKEFTMLNLVEWGTPEDKRVERLKELANIVLKAAHIKGYVFQEDNSVVYGRGLDIISEQGMELASTAMGPHRLDQLWKICCSWVGIGFGLERLIMYSEGEEGIHRYSKSISFLDGARLNIK